jgi:hypothetical protein
VITDQFQIKCPEVVVEMNHASNVFEYT